MNVTGRLKEHFGRTTHRQLLTKLIEENKNILVGRVLDIGSCNRRYDYLVRGEVIAADVNPCSGKNVIFADLSQRLPFDDEEFDSILCIEVIEYLTNIEHALSELNRVLKQGHQGILSVPFYCKDHGDHLRYVYGYLVKCIGRRFELVKTQKIGNGWSVISDILMDKLLNIKIKPIRYISFLSMLPFLYAIHVIGKLSGEDGFYSGVFCIVSKR